MLVVRAGDRRVMMVGQSVSVARLRQTEMRPRHILMAWADLTMEEYLALEELDSRDRVVQQTPEGEQQSGSFRAAMAEEDSPDKIQGDVRHMRLEDLVGRSLQTC